VESGVKSGALLASGQFQVSFSIPTFKRGNVTMALEIKSENNAAVNVFFADSI
jgi:hypothetical protein